MMFFFCGSIPSDMPITLAKLLGGMAIMAVVTYFCRMLTLVLVRKKIKNRFIKSLLKYVPFGVLAAMIFPGIFFSTAIVWSALAGTVVASILAFFRRGLFTVSMGATATVLVMELILQASGCL